MVSVGRHNCRRGCRQGQKDLTVVAMNLYYAKQFNRLGRQCCLHHGCLHQAKLLSAGTRQEKLNRGERRELPQRLNASSNDFAGNLVNP
jgi:hypothetical protein